MAWTFIWSCAWPIDLTSLSEMYAELKAYVFGDILGELQQTAADSNPLLMPLCVVIVGAHGHGIVIGNGCGAHGSVPKKSNCPLLLGATKTKITTISWLVQYPLGMRWTQIDTHIMEPTTSRSAVSSSSPQRLLPTVCMLLLLPHSHPPTLATTHVAYSSSSVSWVIFHSTYGCIYGCICIDGWWIYDGWMQRWIRFEWWRD